MSTQRCKEKSSPTHGGQRERETPSPLAPLFICFFPPPGPALCKLGKSGVLLVLPEVLTMVPGPSFVLFSQASLFLVF